MEALLQSFMLVVLSEMGDKTQLLALVLALRFKQPFAVMYGILVATLLNHSLATVLGSYIGQNIPQSMLQLILAVVFWAFAIWVLFPDKIDENEANGSGKWSNSAFLVTTILFFLAEMGDKTQLATVALGAKFQSTLYVTIGTTLGMLIADGIFVFFGEKITKYLPLKLIRIISAMLFFGFGLISFFTR